MNIPNELNMATKYKMFFDILGNLLSSFSICSTKPKIDEAKIVPQVAEIPIFVKYSSSSLNIFSLSPIQVYNPAIMHVKAASDPMLTTNSKGNIEETIDENILLYEHLCSFLTV